MNLPGKIPDVFPTKKSQKKLKNNRTLPQQIPKEIDTSCSSDAGDTNIKVFVRIRPSKDETPSYGQVVEVNRNSAKQVILNQGQTPRIFSFDYVADVDTRQETIFNSLGKKVIENCIAGYNGTIFAYGQTGSGKTYTMLGPSTDNFEDELRGVIPRSFEYLFNLIKREKEIHGENKQFLCKCSFLEIYNEQIFDLIELNPKMLQLRESMKTGVYVSELSERIVTDANEAFQVLNSSWMNRRVASTSMNRESSRSHAVFTLTVESKEIKGGSERIKTSQLNLVDLAGSESQKNTNSSGLRLKEAGSINKSLSNLGSVIMALSDGKDRYVRYRDSKLTFLLRDSLGGNSKTSMIACVHPGHKYYSETLSTLNFAKRAKMIKTKAVLNENAQHNIVELLLENKMLKEALAQLRSSGANAKPASVGEDSDAHQEPVEPTPELKKMFMNAMQFYQKAEMAKVELENEMTDQKKKFDNNIRQKVMIIKFREDALKRFEKKKQANEVPDKTVENLQAEIELLKNEIDHHPLVTKYSGDLQKLRKEIQMYKASDDWQTKVKSDHELTIGLEQKYKQLIAEQKASEDEPLSTPNRVDMISTATLEKLRSENKDLAAENNMLKQSLSDTKEEMEEKIGKYSSKLEWFEKSNKDLQYIIAAMNARNTIEKAQMTEKHLQTVINITTPKKEAYKLRNRVVEAVSDSPLDTSIPFESEDGIMGEDQPEELVEQANQAFCEQIKRQQELISNLEMRIGEFDSDRIQYAQTQSMQESRLTQMEELLEKEKNKEMAARVKVADMVSKMKDYEEKMSRDAEEINDLRMVLKSADNELRDVKQKYKAAETSQLGDKYTFTTMIEKLERKLEQNEKELEEASAINGDLRNTLDVTNATLAFKEDLCLKLEDVVREKEAALQSTEEKLYKERWDHENHSNLLNSEGIAKEQLYQDQCTENGKLMSEISDLGLQLNKSKESEEQLKKIIKQTEENISHMYQRLEEASNKEAEFEQTINTLTEEIETLKNNEEQNLEEVKTLEIKIQVIVEEQLIEKSKHAVQIDQLEEDLASLQTINKYEIESKDRLTQTVEDLKKDLELMIKENTQLNEINKQMKEESNEKLSNKEREYQNAFEEIDKMTSSYLESQTDNQRIKALLSDTEKERDDATMAMEELNYKNRELQEWITTQNEEIKGFKEQLAQVIGEQQSLRLDRDQMEKELEFTNQELKRMKCSLDEKEDLEKTVERLTEVAKKYNDDKMSMEAEIELNRNGFKKIQLLFDEKQDPDLCDIEYIQNRIGVLKVEYKKLLEENNILIGHSNHKQKLRYHEQVKQENSQLKHDLLVLQGKYRHLNDWKETVRKEMREGEKALLYGNKLKENIKPPHRNFLSGDYSSKS